jgi:hypothetical protein
MEMFNELSTVLTVIVGLIIFKKITGLIFKIIFLIILIGIAFYVYNGGMMDLLPPEITSLIKQLNEAGLLNP